MSTLVECDWSPSGQNFVKSRKQSLQTVSHNATDQKMSLHKSEGPQNVTPKENANTGNNLHVL